jgi:hypothetical protein
MGLNATYYHTSNPQVGCSNHPRRAIKSIIYVNSNNPTDKISDKSIFIKDPLPPLLLT